MPKEIYITENQYQELLSNLLRESLNIDKVGDKELTECYISYKEHFGFPNPMNELFLEEWEPRCITQNVETAIRKIKEKYSLHDWQIYKANGENNVGIVICIADVEDNIEDLKEDLDKLGYHVGCETQKQDKQGRTWQYMQFEPIYSGDCTEYIRENCKLLFHWTPTLNLEKIKSEGIVPNHKSKTFSYPDRVYLFTDKNDGNSLKLSGFLFAKINKAETLEKEIPYSLLFIRVDMLPEGIHFFYDPNMENAVYTEQVIPADSIIKTFETKF